MTRTQRSQVVIDTNVWLSGLLFGGTPGRVLELFIDGTIIVVTSEELLSELRRKIILKFPLFVPKLELLEESIRKDATMVRLGETTVKISRDPDDDKFLETAIAGNCAYIISGDSDLLSLTTYNGIQIVTSAQFLRARNPA
jgi:putative PIN family toxin of toxin-antitoxin system